MRTRLDPRRHSPRATLATALVAIALAASGCGGAEGWHPAPPSGTTYTFEYQGFKEKGTTAFGGVVGIAPGVGLAYGGAFSFREGSELMGDKVSDPFAESTPIDGVRFNAHLGNRGIPLAPRVAGSSQPPAPAASAPTGGGS